MIAHLPMYDTAENKSAHGRLWGAFRDHWPGDAPDLRAASNLWADWQAPNLFLSQTCGLPFRAKLRGKVQLVATPNNGLAGCPPGHYRSAIVTRRGSDVHLAGNDFTLAYNEPLSQSGWGAPWAEGITGHTQIQTGGHRFSAQAVLDGRADVAALDALTWHFLQRDWAGAEGLKVMHWTQPTPTLPYITSLSQDAGAIRQTLGVAIAALSHADRHQLQLFDVVDIPAADYLAVPIPTPPTSGPASGIA